jgi:hypothetical protein
VTSVLTGRRPEDPVELFVYAPIDPDLGADGVEHLVD